MNRFRLLNIRFVDHGTAFSRSRIEWIYALKTEIRGKKRKSDSY